MLHCISRGTQKNYICPPTNLIELVTMSIWCNGGYFFNEIRSFKSQKKQISNPKFQNL